MRAVTVTIGRNVGDDPLPAEAWNDYVAATRRAFDAATSERWAIAPYRGSWEGVHEDAMIYFGALIDDPNAATALRVILANLAGYYGQETVGLAIGTSELVEATPALVPEGARS
jgi:hypothetical protein